MNKLYDCGKKKLQDLFIANILIEFQCTLIARSSTIYKGLRIVQSPVS